MHQATPLIVLAASLLIQVTCNTQIHRSFEPSIDWANVNSNYHANFIPKTKVNHRTFDFQPYPTEESDESYTVDNRLDVQTDIINNKDSDNNDYYLNEDKDDDKRMLMLKLKSLYVEGMVHAIRGKRFDKETEDVGDDFTDEDKREKEEISYYPQLIENKSKPVQKRIFTLWTRHDEFPNSRKDFSHRRHFHQWLNGDFVSAETRTPLSRPPGSPLRWG